MLTKENIEDYKKKLEAERVKLLSEIKEEETPTNFGDDIDPDEEADEAEEFADKKAIAQGLRDRANEVEEALSRIENGSYGACSACGKEIEREVLDAAPESLLCRICKQK